MRRILVSLFLIALFISVEALAFDLKPLLQLGFDGSLSNEKVQAINSGSGLAIGAGIRVALSETHPIRYETELAYNYKFQSDGNANDAITFRKNIYEILSLVHHIENGVRFGAGGTFHSGVKAKGEGKNSSVSEVFDDSVGFIAMAEKTFTSPSGEQSLGLKYSKINYKQAGEVTSGDSLGVYYRLGFY